MCEYCEHGEGIVDASGFYIYIQESDDGDYMLDVNYDGCDESASAWEAINYCPMCGRKLNEA